MQSTNNNLADRLKVVLTNYGAFVKEGLRRGLFQTTEQVLIVHTDLEELKRIINEQSKQQSGADNLDSGKKSATAGANSTDIQPKKRQRKIKEGQQPAAGGDQPGPGAGEPEPVELNGQELPFTE